MLFEELLQDREEKGRKEGIEKGIEKGIIIGIYQSVEEHDYSFERGAEKLGKSLDEFMNGYNVWKNEREK